MKQIYHPYTKWEDWMAGMYNDADVLNKHILVFNSIDLLSSIRFYGVIKQMAENWPNATEHNLTNAQHNRRAWIGAAACMYSHKCPEYLTRVAWSLLNKDVQNIANNIAEKFILEYEAKNKEIHSRLGVKGLF